MFFFLFVFCFLFFSRKGALPGATRGGSGREGASPGIEEGVPGEEEAEEGKSGLSVAQRPALADPDSVPSPRGTLENGD